MWDFGGGGDGPMSRGFQLKGPVMQGPCLLVSPASVHPWFGTRGNMISQARSRIIVRDDLESAALSGHWSCSMGAYRPNYRDAHA